MRAWALLLAVVLCPVTQGDEVLPVRYTPADVDTPSLSLAGVWRFYPNAGPDFYREPHATDQPRLTIPVPSEIETTYPELVRGNLESAGFFREVHVPADWADRSIKLRFRSIEGAARIYINQEFSGFHAGPWVPFEIDATPWIKPGQVNTIAVHASINTTIILSGRGFLGMGFEPELIAVPRVNLAAVHLNTTFDDAYRDAVLEARVRVANESDTRARGQRVELRLFDPALEQGAPPIATAEVDLPTIAAGETADLAIDIDVDAPKQWTPETPHRYRVETRLIEGDSAAHTARHMIGFRQIEVQDDHVLLNGQVLKIRGVGYHHVPHYKRLHAVTREDLRRDMEMMKYANFNMVRAAPYPDLIEICDEIGLMTAVETTVGGVEMTWMPHTHGLGTDEDFYRDYQRMLAQLVEVFRNAPSVITWNLGNESLFTLPVFVDGGFMVQELDPSRIVWAEAHDSEELGKNLPQTTVDNYHYPDMMAKGLPDKRPIFYGEWAHIHEYAKADFRTDPAVLDHWVHAYENHLDYMRRETKVLGGFLFYGVSFTIRTKNVWGGIERDWGILDRFRRPKPEFWNVKKANSPLRLRASGFAEDGASARLTLQNYSRFVPTTAYTWEARLNGHPVEIPQVSDIPALESGDVVVALPRAVEPGDELVVDVHAPAAAGAPEGMLIDRYALRVDAETAPPNRTADLQWAEQDGELRITGGGYAWAIDLSTGLLCDGRTGDVRVLESGPYLTATRQHTRGSTPCTNWSLQDLSWEEQDGALVVTAAGAYDQAEGAFTYRFDRAGVLDLGYDFDWKLENVPATRPYHTPPDSMEMREVGVSFALPQAMQRLRWSKDTHWTWYPEGHIGRPFGQANATHTPMPGYAGPDDRLPWQLEANAFGTRDFRSTKTRIRHAALEHHLGTGAFEVFSDGSQAVRAYLHPEKPQVWLTLIDRYAGGHEKFLQGNRIYSTPRILLDQGEKVQGQGTLVLR
ncbi:MAG: glycoside hydrolase family 2 TIM barrel-domain containing protein [Planctomycetota bacterium]